MRHVRDEDQVWGLGTALEQARTLAGLNQAEAARAAGISPTLWGQLENGRVPLGDGQWKRPAPKPSTVTAVANAVGMDVNEALRLAGHDPQRYVVDRGGRPTVSRRRLAEKISGLPEDLIGALNVIVDALNDGSGQPVERAATPDACRPKTYSQEGTVGSAPITADGTSASYPLPTVHEPPANVAQQQESQDSTRAR